jgi:hypothetical protein
VRGNSSNSNNDDAGAPVPWTWTILRPCEFTSNYIGPGIAFQAAGLSTTGAWRSALPADFGIALVDVADIGRVAAAALLDSCAPEWRNRALDVIGDVATPGDVARLLGAAAGKPLRAGK